MGRLEELRGLELGCCFCKGPLLNLSGFEESLSSQQIPHGNAALGVERAIGKAHSGCLVKTIHGAAWSRGRFEHLRDVMGWQSLGQVEDVKGVFETEIGDFRLFWENGYSAGFRERHLKRAKRVAGGALVPRNQECNLCFEPESDVLKEVRQALQVDGTYPVFSVFEHLDVQHALVHSQAFENAHFVSDPRLESYNQDAWVSCRVMYDIFLTDSALKLLAEFGVESAQNLLQESVPRPAEDSGSKPHPPNPFGLPLCCFCSEPVLNLEGEYGELTADMLLVETDPIREQKALGLAHVTCLRRTRYGKPWADRRVRYAETNPDLERAWRREDVRALWEPSSGRSHMIWDDGRTLTMTPAEGEESSQFLLREQNLEITLDIDEATSSLWDLVNRLGLAERMLASEEMLRQGTVSKPSSGGSVHVEYLVPVCQASLELAFRGGYPRLTTDSFFAQNPHCKNRVRKRESPLAPESKDVLVDFLSRYESSPDQRSPTFRVHDFFARGQKSHTYDFTCWQESWTVCAETHKVYRPGAGEGDQKDVMRTDSFLTRLLESLPKD